MSSHKIRFSEREFFNITFCNEKREKINVHNLTVRDDPNLWRQICFIEKTIIFTVKKKYALKE